MDHSQAIVTAFIRVVGGMSLFLLVGTILITPTVDFKPADFAEHLPDNDQQIQSIDFIGGTVVHINWFGYSAIVFCILLIVFSKRVAFWITPEINNKTESGPRY